MGIENSKQPNQPEITTEEKAGAWRKRCQEALDELFTKENPTRDELVNVLWEHAILDRIAPSDPSEKDARRELGKTVWQGDREDPKLYWRILYSTWTSLKAMEERFTYAATNKSLIQGVFEGINRTLQPGKSEKFFPGYPTDHDVDPYEFIFKKIVERAKQEIKRRGLEPHNKPIPEKSTGTWRGIKFTIGPMSDDGMIHPQFFDREEMLKIPSDKLEEILTHGISPDELNPENFVSPKKKE